MHIRLLIICLVLPLSAAEPSSAAELTVETKPFRIERSFEATAIPAGSALLRLDPDAWEKFEIASLANHGQRVKAGDVLITFDREGYDRRVEDLEREIATKELALASRELAYQKLKEEVEIGLEKARRANAIAKEDLDYFTETGEAAAKAGVAQRLKRANFSVASAKEELKQLKAMYEADDLTEETEEIILDRQKIAVEFAEFGLEEAEREAALTLETALPRQGELLERTAAETAIALAKAEKDLPRSLEVAEIELASARIELERARLDQERLEKDAGLFEMKAAIDGIFYHGALEDGEWKLGELAKVLVEGGTAPLKRSFASVAPVGGGTPLSARVEPALARAIAPESKFPVVIPGREDLALTGTLATLEPVPGADGKHPLTISVEWPEDFDVVPAMKAQCVVVAYENPAAIVLPAKTIAARADGGWGVSVKLADGKTENRKVTRGRVLDEKVEILDGLEVGQVVITPE